MLGKLLKYEIKAMGRVMLPLYGVLLFVAGLLALNLRLGMNPAIRQIVDKFAVISGFLFVIGIIAVGVVMIVMIVQRFYKNLLGTEGYLMFSLPATTLEHILSKGLSALLWIIIGGVAGIAAGFLMVGIVSDVPEFLRQIRELRDMFFSSWTTEFVLFIVLIIVGLMESLCKVYAAISVGHQFNSHRLLFSALAYIAFGIIEMVISLPLSSDGVAFGKIIGKIVDTNGMPPASALWILIVISLIGILIYGALAWYLLDRRLNLVAQKLRPQLAHRLEARV